MPLKPQTPATAEGGTVLQHNCVTVSSLKKYAVKSPFVVLRDVRMPWLQSQAEPMSVSGPGHRTSCDMHSCRCA